MEAQSRAFVNAKEDFLKTKPVEELPQRTEQDTDALYKEKMLTYFSSLSLEDKNTLGKIHGEKLASAIANLHVEDRQIYNATKHRGGFEAWVQAYRKARFACQLKFHPLTNRFKLHLDPRYVKRVRLSEQLAYILGFEGTDFTDDVTEARFMPDMRGGVSSFHVYAPDLIQPMMIVDAMAPVLRIVTIRGHTDQIIEEQFLSIQYHRLLLKEITELFIEIRTHSGGLMPFQYGTCTLTLHFRKIAYF
jgi:hypothetical protein